MSFEALKSFCDSYLSDKQVKGIRARVQEFKKGNAMVKAFNYLLEHPDSKISNVAMAIGSKSIESTYRTCNDLYERILEFIISKYNRDQSPYYDWWKCEVEAMNYFNAAFTCYSLPEVKKDLFTRVIALAKKYELYEVWYRAHIWIQNDGGFTHGIKFYEAMEEERLAIKSKRDAAEEALQVYYRFVIENKNFTGSTKQLRTLKAMVTDLKELWIDTGSTKVGFLWHSLRFEVAKHTKKALAIADNWIDFIKSNEAIYDERRIGMVYDQLAEHHIMSGEFESAVEVSHIAREAMKSDPVNKDLPLLYELEATYHMEDYERCNELIGEILNSGLDSKFKDQAKYTGAYALHMMGYYNEADNAITDLIEMKRNDHGWYVGRKLLETINNYERGFLDLVEYNIKALNKYRYDHKKQLTTREHAMVNVLVSLERNGFNFNKTFETCQPDFEKFEESRPGTYELIDLNTWFIKKMAKIAA